MRIPLRMLVKSWADCIFRYSFSISFTKLLIPVKFIQQPLLPFLVALVGAKQCFECITPKGRHLLLELDVFDVLDDILFCHSDHLLFVFFEPEGFQEILLRHFSLDG